MNNGEYGDMGGGSENGLDPQVTMVCFNTKSWSNDLYDLGAPP